MKNHHRGLFLATVMAIAVFAAASACGCFAIMGRYMVDQDMHAAGETFVSKVRPNCLALSLVLSASQLGLGFVAKRWARIAGTVLAVATFLSTIGYKLLCDLFEQIMGGVVSYYCEVTVFGYIAITASVLVVVLQIISLKKQG